MSFIYIQVKTGSSYASLPTKKQVSLSSAEYRLLPDDESILDRPYVYIFKCQSAVTSAKYKVMLPKPTDVIPHQACLTVSSSLTMDGMDGAYKSVLEWICTHEYDNKGRPLNQSLYWDDPNADDDSGSEFSGGEADLDCDDVDLLMERVAVNQPKTRSKKRAGSAVGE